MGETALCPYVKITGRPDAGSSLINTIQNISINSAQISRAHLEAARGLIKDPTSREGLEIYSEDDLKGNDNGNEIV